MMRPVRMHWKSQTSTDRVFSSKNKDFPASHVRFQMLWVQYPDVERDQKENIYSSLEKTLGMTPGNLDPYHSLPVPCRMFWTHEPPLPSRIRAASPSGTTLDFKARQYGNRGSHWITIFDPCDFAH